MLENLTERLQSVIKTIRGQSRFSEENISDAMREVRIALIEADVALPVVKYFIDRVKEKALGAEVLKSVTPGQAIIKIVQDELTSLMGIENVGLELSTKPPAVILMAGLQGSGKTTTVAKLAKILQDQKKKVLVASADVYRPAAIEQLKTLALSLKVDCFDSSPKDEPIKIATATLDYAKKYLFDVIIFDTAGRLGIDEAMMKEIKQLHKTLSPIETLFVVDAMQGQDAVNTAKSFGEALPLTGIVLTKLDGDARGGAAVSITAVTGVPIKFIGVSEKVEGLEPFDPERIVNRILGFGDVVSLVEKAQDFVNEDDAKKLEEKLKNATFDLDDFRKQLKQIKSMGSLNQIMSMMPGMNRKLMKGMDFDDKKIIWTDAIISSMTFEERKNPSIIDGSRRSRISKGSGRTVQEINQLLKQFTEMKKMMKKMGKMKMPKNLKNQMMGIN